MRRGQRNPRPDPVVEDDLPDALEIVKEELDAVESFLADAIDALLVPAAGNPS